MEEIEYLDLVDEDDKVIGKEVWWWIKLWQRWNSGNFLYG